MSRCRDCGSECVKLPCEEKPGKFVDQEGSYWYGKRCPECAIVYRKMYDGGWRHGQDSWDSAEGSADGVFARREDNVSISVLRLGDLCY